MLYAVRLQKFSASNGNGVFEIFSAELLLLQKLLRVKLGRDLCRSLSSAAMHAAAGAHTRLRVLTIKKLTLEKSTSHIEKTRVVQAHCPCICNDTALGKVAFSRSYNKNNNSIEEMTLAGTQ